MADRTIAVRLKLEMADFSRQMASAAEATRKGAADIDRNGQKIQTSMGRMVRSVEVNREAWTRAGGALTAYGVALGGVAVAILNTGIAYNTLQQASRAALKTVLGSAEAVNAQMDKLDEFARTSPFAKQVFITAQQQMLAFGIETQKVIPYLDALQNAVAAAGGNNQTLTELAQIISKIHAAGKLTAQDFIEFGNRGVDAATLIGSQMNMTGAEIRESVTKGLIDADDALDALIKGMDEKFSGASANVKATFVGALDRVKAAWRDLASELTAPLVDPQGGGALVDWLNKLADAMRGFQHLPEGLKHSIEAAVTLTGVIAVLGGAFLLLTPRILATKTALDTMGISLGKLAKGGSIAAGLFIAFTALDAAVNHFATRATTGVEETTQALLDMGTAADDLTGVFKGISDDTFGLTGNVNNITDAAKRLTAPSLLGRMMDFGGSIRGIFGQNVTARTKSIDQINEIGEALAGLVQSGHADIAAQKFEVLKAQWEAGGGSLKQLEELMPAYRAALADVDNQQQLTASSSAKSAEQLKAEADAAEAAAKALEAYHDMLATANSSFISATDAYQAVIDKNRELAQATADATKSAKDSWETYYDGHTVKVKDYIKQLRDQVKAQKAWRDDLAKLTDRVNHDTAGNLKDSAKEMLNQLVGQGAGAAPLIDMLANASDADFNKIVALWKKGGSDANQAFAESFDEALNPEVKPTLNMLGASTEYGNWVKAMSNIPLTPNVTLPSSKGGGGGGGPVPRKYAGGGHQPGGIAMVGEFGQELVHFDSPGRVHTSAETRDMLAAAMRGTMQPGPVQQLAPQVITVPVSSTHTMAAPVNIQNGYFNTPGDAGMAALERLNRKSGG